MRVIQNGKYRSAVASGKGIGKSALVAWIILWAMSTMAKTRGVVTAGTKTQLTTKTWPELTKWYNMMVCRHWFVMAATSMHSAQPELKNQWVVDAIPWSEQNKEAFAGLHNESRRQFIIFDEASQIADVIWEQADGLFTDNETEAMHITFGNPTRNTGRFRECWGQWKHRYRHISIDSRTVAISDKDEIKKWVEDYGEDSDYVRVNVRGLFPSVSDMQFIPTGVVEEARKREVPAMLHEALIMGVDVARYGNDESVISFRKGRDAKSIPWVKLRGVSVTELAAKVADLASQMHPQAVFVDEGGVGGGVVDVLQSMNVANVRGIQFGGKPDRAHVGTKADMIKYANKRAEMWGVMRDNLRTLAIPDDDDLQDDLIGVMYGMNGKDAIILESKEDMKRRGLASPDRGDALALTFAYPSLPTPMAGGPYKHQNMAIAAHEYDPFSAASMGLEFAAVYTADCVANDNGILWRPFNLPNGGNPWAHRRSPSPRCPIRSRRRPSRRPRRNCPMRGAGLVALPAACKRAARS